MDDLSLDDLFSGLQAAQQKKSAVRLSERNVVELVVKLKQLGFFGDDLLHTSNGREYITREKLKQEVIDAITAADGRLPLVDLPSILSVDLSHCERAAEEIISSSQGSVTLAQGELLTTAYFDGVAEEINAALQSSGVVAVGDIARRTGLGVEMLNTVLQDRIGKAIQGTLDGGILYTDGYLARIKAQVRGALRGALGPVNLSVVKKDIGVGGLGALVPALADDLIKQGEVEGKVGAGGVFVPSIYAQSQQDYVRSFFKQNGYIAFDVAAKHGVTAAALPQFLSTAIGTGTGTKEEKETPGMALSTVFASDAIVHQVEAAVEDAFHSASWCDVIVTVPGSFSPSDAAQILSKCVALNSSSSSSFSSTNVVVLADTVAVSSAFLHGIRGVLVEEAKKAAREAHALRKNKQGSSSAQSIASSAASNKRGGGGGGGGAGGGGNKSTQSFTVDDDSDDDWGIGGGGGGKGKKGKGGGGGGGGGGKKGKGGKQWTGGAAPPTFKAKGSGATATNPRSSSDMSGATNTTATASVSCLSLDHLEKRVVELHPDTEGAGAEGDLPSAIATDLRPSVVAEYERTLSDIFTAGAERRRRLREAASAALVNACNTLQVLVHGAALFAPDDATSTILHRHIMQTAAAPCLDALLHFLSADIAEEEGGEGGQQSVVAAAEDVVAKPLSPAQRSNIIRESPPETQASLTAAIDALGAAAKPTSAADFVGLMEEAADAAGVRVRRVDKKTEAPLVQAHVQRLKVQVGEAGDAPTLLAAAVPALLALRRGRCVSIPGRALGPAVELLKEDLGEDDHAALVEFHQVVVESLKGGEVDGGRVAALSEKVKSMI